MSYTYHYINEDYKGAGQALMQELAQRTNLNASGLARAIGLAPSTVTRILQGRTCPSYDDMLGYAWALAFTIEDNALVRPKHLHGCNSPAELGEFVNQELAQGLNAENLQFLLRMLPKESLDWQKMKKSDRDKILLQPARINDPRFQALFEGITSYVCHSFLWEDAPVWTKKTKLDKLFVPRAATREIGTRRFKRLSEKCSPEFTAKNIIFTHDEMQVI